MSLVSLIVSFSLKIPALLSNRVLFIRDQNKWSYDRVSNYKIAIITTFCVCVLTAYGLFGRLTAKEPDE